MSQQGQPFRFRLAFYRIVNAVFRFTVRTFGKPGGNEQDALRLLEVRGRLSGRTFLVPIRLAIFREKRYVISLLGISQWSRNLSTNNEARILVGRHSEVVTAVEASETEKAAFLEWYCSIPSNLSRVRTRLPDFPKAPTRTDIERITPVYPVFRLEAGKPS